MFCYTVSLKADKGKFKKICNLIESYFHNCNLEKETLILDELLSLDYYLEQRYKVEGKEIKVICENFEVDAVYVDSTIDLKNALNGEVVVQYVK